MELNEYCILYVQIISNQINSYINVNLLFTFRIVLQYYWYCINSILIREPIKDIDKTIYKFFNIIIMLTTPELKHASLFS